MPDYDDQGLPDEAFTETERAAGVPDLARGYSSGRRRRSYPPGYKRERKPGGIQAAIAGAMRFQTFDEAKAWAMQNPDSSFVPDSKGGGYKPSRHPLWRGGTSYLNPESSGGADVELASYMLRRHCPHLLRYWEHNDSIEQFSEVAVNKSLARLPPEVVREFQTFLLDFRNIQLRTIGNLELERARGRHSFSTEISRSQHLVAALERAIRCAKQFC